MYLQNKVKIPFDTSGITRKTIRGVTYVYYTYGRTFRPPNRLVFGAGSVELLIHPNHAKTHDFY